MLNYHGIEVLTSKVIGTKRCLLPELNSEQLVGSVVFVHACGSLSLNGYEPLKETGTTVLRGWGIYDGPSKVYEHKVHVPNGEATKPIQWII